MMMIYLRLINMAVLWCVSLDVLADCGASWGLAGGWTHESGSVPVRVQLGSCFADHINNTYGFAIVEHLINNRECASTYSADLFTILSRSHSDFHLKLLDTIHLFLPINHPSVSRENVYRVLV